MAVLDLFLVTDLISCVASCSSVDRNKFLVNSSFFKVGHYLLKHDGQDLTRRHCCQLLEITFLVARVYLNGPGSSSHVIMGPASRRLCSLV